MHTNVVCLNFWSIDFWIDDPSAPLTSACKVARTCAIHSADERDQVVASHWPQLQQNCFGLCVSFTCCRAATFCRWLEMLLRILLRPTIISHPRTEARPTWNLEHISSPNHPFVLIRTLERWLLLIDVLASVTPAHYHHRSCGFLPTNFVLKLHKNLDFGRLPNQS